MENRLVTNREKRVCGSRLAFAVAACSLLFSASSLSGIIQQTVDFSTSGQPIWGGEPSPEFSAILAETVVGADGFGLNAVTDLGPLGDYGVEATITAGVEVGFQASLRDFQSGEIDVSYPVNVRLELPDEISPGETFTISSTYSVAPTASFESTVEDSKLDLGAAGKLLAELRLRACIIDCFVDSTDPSSPLFFDQEVDLGSFDLITQTKDETTINVPGFSDPVIAGSGIDIDPSQDITIDPVDAALDIAISEVTNISGKIQAADLSQTGSDLVGGLLSGTITDVFTDITVDLDSFFSPPAPPLGLGPFTVSGVTLGADIFDADFITKLIAQQTLAFEGTPTVSLDLGTLGTVSMALGDSVDITVPTDFSGDLQINPTFSLDNTLTNTSTVAAAQQTDISFGRLIAGFPEIQVTPDLPSIVIPGTSGFCLVRNIFNGSCSVFIPGTPAITVFPGADGLSVGPFDFNEAIFEESITDSIIDTTIAGVPISVDSCEAAGNACNALPLLSEDGARTSEVFSDTLSLAFASLTGSAFAVRVSGASSVPVSMPLLLMLLGMLMLGWINRPSRLA